MWHSNGKVFPHKNQHHYDSTQPKEPRLASTATLGSLPLFCRRAQPRDPDAAMASLRGAHAEADSDGRGRTPCNTRSRLAGCAFTGQVSNLLARGARVQLIVSSLPGLTLAQYNPPSESFPSC